MELTGKFSFRVGVYRIIYKVNKKDKVVDILTAGHRATVYE
jgi:mRNA-degrading endonuclease RelE of RelBE toxin-antitoxin system